MTVELTTPCPGWRIERHETRSGFRSYEVAISPAGVEYVRTPTRDLADLIVHTRYAGDAFWKLRSRPFTTTQEDAP